MAFKKSEVWVEVPEDMMKKFNQDHMLAPFKHLGFFRYYGSAMHQGLSKQHTKTGQCYIYYKALIKWNPAAEAILQENDNML